MTMSKKFQKSLLFVAVFAVLATVLHFLLIAGLRRYEGGASFDVWNQVMDGKAGADILISGSSRALINFDCEAISRVTNKSCFNIGLDGSKINLDIARVKAYLKHNPKPKVLIQAAGIGELQYGGLLRLYQYAPYLNDDDIYESLVSQLPEFWHYKYIPLYSFAVYNSELVGRAVKGLFNIRALETDWPRKPRIRGFLSVDIEWTNEYDKFKEEFPEGGTFEVLPKAVNVWEELIELCRKQGIEFVIVFPPAFNESVYRYTKNVDEIFGTYRELARKHNVAFMDYSRIPMTFEQKYFYNSQHMNYRGAAMFSGILAADLVRQSQSLSKNE